MRLLCLMLMAGAALAAPALTRPSKRDGDWRQDYEMVEETGFKVAGFNFALDNKDWANEEKAHAQIWDYHGGDNQRFFVFNKLGDSGKTSNGDQLFRLMRKNSDFCLNFYHDSESSCRVNG